MPFLVKKLVRWVLLLLAIPVTVWTADKIADQLEQRRGHSNATRALRAPGRWRRGEPLFADHPVD